MARLKRVPILQNEQIALRKTVNSGMPVALALSGATGYFIVIHNSEVYPRNMLLFN